MSDPLHPTQPPFFSHDDEPTMIDDLREVKDDLLAILQDLMMLQQQQKITFRHNTTADLQILAQALCDRAYFTDVKLLIEALIFVSKEKKPIDLTLLGVTAHRDHTA